jgi:hypothetical protein
MTATTIARTAEQVAELEAAKAGQPDPRTTDAPEVAALSDDTRKELVALREGGIPWPS